jgi:hypothetical protein
MRRLGLKDGCILTPQAECQKPEQRVILLRMPGWRNGRRYGLKIRWEKSREGSNPSLGTNTINTLAAVLLHR